MGKVKGAWTVPYNLQWQIQANYKADQKDWYLGNNRHGTSRGFS